MHRTPRLLSCLLVAVAVLVSGCGSTKKKSTSSAASQNASTGASANLGAQTVPRGATTKESQQAHKAVQPKTAEAKPEQKHPVAEAEEGRRIQREQKTNEHAAARIGLEVAEANLPVKRRYPKELQGRFMLACKAAKGSTSTCECIIALQETNLKVERGQTLAELFALEIAFRREHRTLEDVRRRRVRSPRLVRRVVRECR